MIKKLPYKEFVKIYSKVPRLCVDLIIKSKDGILFIKRDIEPAKGKWHFPGGTVLMGETIEKTSKRVAAEETGLRIKIIKITGILQFLNYPKAIGQVMSIVILTEPTSLNLRGSKQGKNLKFFKKIPENTVREQADFLREHKLLN